MWSDVLGMIEAQQNALLIVCSFHRSGKKWEFIDEYRKLNGGNYSKENILDFLVDKLPIQGYLEIVGLA